MSTNQSPYRIGSALAALMLATSVAAQTYPSKPIRFIVPFAPATTTDMVARYVGERITQMTGQSVVVENRAGGNGVIGAQAAAQAAADGYNVFIATNTTQAANLSLMRKLPYDPVQDFVPVTNLIRGGVVLAVRPDLPSKTLQELIAAAKKDPNKYTFASGNSSSRAGGELFKLLAGIELVHVPYKSIPAGVTDVLGGRIDMILPDAPAIGSHLQAGRLRALGVSSSRRMTSLPDVPTMIEAGLPNFEYYGWVAMFVPAKTPQDLVGRLNQMTVEIMRQPAARDYFDKLGWETVPGTPAELGRFVESEIEKWKRIVQAAKIEPE